MERQVRWKQVILKYEKVMNCGSKQERELIGIGGMYKKKR